MPKSKLKGFGSHVIVEPKKEKKSKGDIVVSEVKENGAAPISGKVIAVPKRCQDAQNDFHLKAGQTVYFNRYEAHEIGEKKNPFYAVELKHILAVE